MNIQSINAMKLVIPSHSLHWSIHTKDESKRGAAFAFIFGVNWLWRCGGTASFKVFFHEIKCDGMTSFMEFMLGICLCRSDVKLSHPTITPKILFKHLHKMLRKISTFLSPSPWENRDRGVLFFKGKGGPTPGARGTVNGSVLARRRRWHKRPRQGHDVTSFTPWTS